MDAMRPGLRRVAIVAAIIAGGIALGIVVAHDEPDVIVIAMEPVRARLERGERRRSRQLRLSVAGRGFRLPEWDLGRQRQRR